MKTLTIKPAEEIEIRDPETGAVYNLVFNTRAVLIFQSAIGGKKVNVNELANDLLPLVIYASANSKGEMSKEDAEGLAERMSAESGMAIVNAFLESLSDSLSEEQKKNIQKTIRRMVLAVK